MAKSNNNTDVSGVIFAGCVVLGIGIGVLVNQAGAGTLIGVGVGFIAMAVVRSKNK